MTNHNSTTQQATGRPVLTSINGVGNFLAWTGTDKNQNLNFNFQQKDMTFSKGMISPDGVRCSNYGPDLAVLPDGKTAYIIWADKDNVVKITKMSRAKVTDTSWSVDGSDISVSKSKAASGPCAAFGHQNGQFVLNVLWQDSSKDTIAFTQLPVFGSSSLSSLEMEFLQGDLKASSTPTLVMEGGRSFLAYFDKDKQFNLAIDPSGGLFFNTHQKIEGVTSKSGPAFLPTAPGQAYLFWVDQHKVGTSGITTKLRYQQIGIVAKSGQWALNATPGCGGTILDAVPTGTPSVQIVSIENSKTKVMEKNIRVAWPEGTMTFSLVPNMVLYADVSISHAAMPVVILTAS